MSKMSNKVIQKIQKISRRMKRVIQNQVMWRQRTLCSEKAENSTFVKDSV